MLNPEQQAIALGQSVVTSFDSVVSSLPDSPSKAHAFARRIGVGKDVASRLFNAIRAGDELAAVHHLPGVTGLRQILKAAREHGGSNEAIGRAETALTVFESFVEREFEDRAGLDAVIASSLPDARRAQETASKQTMYRGSVGLKGVTSDVISVVFVCAPSQADAESCDTFVLNGFVGLRRVRPRAVVQFSSTQIEMAADATPTSLRRRGDRELLAFPEFCTPEPMPFDVTRDKNQVHYRLRDLGVGPRTAVNYFAGELDFANILLKATRPDMWPQYFCGTVDHPTKLLVMDVLLHEAMWPECSPSLRVYDTTIYGLADARNRARDKDILDISESIDELGRGLDRWRLPDVPNYYRLLGTAFERLGHHSASFRGYRTRIAYPFYGSQVCSLFSPRSEITHGRAST